MTDLILPDSRFEMPELYYPGRKPVGNVRIDYEHPLSKYLVFLNLGGNRNLTGQEFSQSDLLVNQKEGGAGFDADGNFCNVISISEYPELKQTTNGFTWLSVFYKYSSAADYSKIFGRTANNDGSQPFANWSTALNPVNSGQDKLFINFNSGGTLINLSCDNIEDNYINSAAGVVLKSGGVSGYTQGVLRASIGSNISEHAALSDVIIGGNNSSTPTDTGSIILMCAVWRRELTANEIASLHNNPYQFLIPA